VTEVDFARFKATGATNVVDYGGDPVGAVLPAGTVGAGKLFPQPQRLADGAPFEGAPYRTVQGEVLTQAMHLFLGQTNHTDWGKSEYGADENGGISGIVYYAVTRAENDPQLAVGEPWEPGIARAVLNLYRDRDGNGVIDDLDGDGQPTLADADNFPFQWAPSTSFSTTVRPTRNGPAPRGPRTSTATATAPGIQAMPSTPPSPTALTTVAQWLHPGSSGDPRRAGSRVRRRLRTGTRFATECSTAATPSIPISRGDGFRQRGGRRPPHRHLHRRVGYPPNYELLKEEDKNVDFGLSFTPSPLVTPPLRGRAADGATLPQLQYADGTTPLSGVTPAELIDVFYAGQSRPLCNMKQITAAEAKNAATDFFYFTQVPIAARASVSPTTIWVPSSTRPAPTSARSSRRPGCRSPSTTGPAGKSPASTSTSLAATMPCSHRPSR